MNEECAKLRGNHVEVMEDADVKSANLLAQIQVDVTKPSCRGIKAFIDEV